MQGPGLQSPRPNRSPESPNIPRQPKAGQCSTGLGGQMQHAIIERYSLLESYRAFVIQNPMSQVILELDVPRDWRKFRLPAALDNRLQELLDRQDNDGKLTRAERREAEALVELAEMLSLMKLRADRVSRNGA